jgi:hypothetical protein
VVAGSRFEIRRTLGEGGMGVVYEARDRARDMIVALKTLRILDANLLYHFKNEFRGLADLHHPNLCTLYELVEADGNWCFTMELVEGVDFTSWVRPVDRDAAMAPTAAPTPAPAAGTMVGYAAAATAPARPTPPPTVSTGSWHGIDEARLRDALVQLAGGLEALHAAGKVHRDIKPGNILVTREGRVVIMDFGLVADATLLAELATMRQIAGTPMFMAPEQGVPGANVGPAADWYAVGVMLYEILTAQLPFHGNTVQEILAAKKTPPPAPARLAVGVPADLEELCLRLLAADPAQRPGGPEVLALLGGRTSRPSLPTTDVFVGRRAELGALHAAMADSRQQATAVFVEGSSGLGKSALVRRFLDELADSGTMILSGRCFAEETLPYKAFDGVVDALTRHLVTMDRERAEGLLPDSAGLAARLFPVLHRVPMLPDAPDGGAGVERRARAFAALIEILARVAATQPLLVFVDDLQWADADSLLLLRELLHPASAPRLAFVASVRTGDTDTTRLAAFDARRLQLAPLSADDASLLVDRLLPREAARRRREIAREAAGHPLFLAELAHHAGIGSSDRLDEALWDRARALDDDPRRVLHVIAVAGMPIDVRAVADVMRMSPTKCAPLIAQLRAARFVKTGGDNQVEPYHDRVRESIVTRLERDELAATSGQLADTMLRAGMGESAPELVVRHLFAAGDPARGGPLAEKAAERALALLAFDRAAELYRAAIHAGPRDAAHARTLHLALAAALARAGRGAEAADAYLAAGAAADDEGQLDCRRRAADQLLVSGHVARGLDELGGVLAAMGEEVPETPQDVLASVAAGRAAIDAGLTAGSDTSAALLRRADVFQSTSLGLILVDNVRGADYQARALRLAYASGDRRRMVRALVFESIYRAQEGDAGRKRADQLLVMAREQAGEPGEGLARLTGDAWMDAYLVFGHAFVAYYHGRFRRAVELFKDADGRFRGLAGVAWEQNNCRVHRLRATDYQGAWGELRALYDEYLRDAQRRDDRYVAESITRWFNVLWLAHDRPDLAGADLDKSTWTKPSEGRYHLQHFLELRARVELALYRGEGSAQGWWARPGLEAADRALLLRIQIARAIADWLLGRLAASEGDHAEVDRRARLLADQRINYAAIWSGLLAAAAIAQRRDTAGAVAQLELTAEMADENDFPLCATIARLRAGQLLSEPTRIATATAWMREQDIRDPLRMADVFAPGFADQTRSAMSFASRSGGGSGSGNPP